MIAERSLFYYGAVPEEPERLAIPALGIHERMAPGLISYPAHPGEYLLMFFHSAARAGTPDRMSAAAGELMIWGRDRVYCYGHPEQGWDHSWLRVRGRAFDRIVAQHRLILDRPLGGGGLEALVGRYWRLLHDELHARREPDEYALEQWLNLLVYEVMRQIRGADPEIPEPIRRAERFLVGEIAGAPTLAGAARRAALSIPRFIAVFRQYYGLPPMRYLQQKRMALARTLLRRRNLTIKEVAQHCGFRDPLHFSRCFRRDCGVSPRAYRDAEGQ